MPKIASWLASLELDRYAASFEAAEIDFDTVQYLTDDDLKELGLPMGPRRKILAACSGTVPPPPLPVALPGSAAVDPGIRASERRQLTVMFVDLVDSTNMSVRLDPEVLSDLLVSYKALVAEEIVKGEGLVAKYLGDGVLAYFGWPKAREDAAEFAIHCAFAIVERIGGLKAPNGSPLACRIGIATGLVVVGGETGSGNAREDTVAGEALNLAARLQSLAAPGEIMIGEATHRLTGKLFKCEDRGEHEVKGFDTPLRVWRALRPTTATSRFDAVRTMRATLIGRDNELALLTGRWAKASEGEGRVVLILGEAGIGKSRLCNELHSRIADQPHHYVAWQCSAFHQTNAFYPVIEYFTTAAEIGDDDTPAARLVKLARLLAEAGLPHQDQLALIAELLSIAPEAGYVAPDMTAAEKRAAIIAAIVEWIRCLAERKALLLMVEDSHWIDPSTLDLMTSLISRMTGQRVLAVATGRPEFRPPWHSRPQVSTIGLDRLSKLECEGLVREITSASAAKTLTIEEIVSKGDGNPLFLEELSFAVLDSRKPGVPVVPDSLQSSLMSRLDMLGEAKDAAQICSVLGRRFARPLLVQVVPFSSEILDDRLATLVAHDILHPVGRAIDGRYEFKHALVRDAAYDSLLFSSRRHFHERCGRNLEQNFPDVGRTEPELIAYHFAQAGLPADATRYYEQAGDRAASSSAYVEAASSYRNAIDQLILTSPSAERERLHCELLLKIGPALSVVDGPQASSVGAAYSLAESISAAADDQDSRFKAVWGLWFHANIGRAFDDAEARAQTLVDLAEVSGDSCQQLEAIHCRWSSALFRGDYTFAIADAERGVEIYKPALHHALGEAFGGHDPGVCAHSVYSNALAFTGRFAESVDQIHSAISLAEQLEHPHSLAHALMVSCAATAAARDHLSTHILSERLYEIAAKYRFPPQEAAADFFLGWADAEAGDTASGLTRMRSVFPRLVELSPMPMLYAGLFAEQLLRADIPDEALAVAGLPLGNRMLTRKGLFLSEVYRTRGIALARTGRESEATADFDQAYLIADRQGSPLFQMRALESQIRLRSSSRPLVDVTTELRELLGEQTALQGSEDFRQASIACT